MVRLVGINIPDKKRFVISLTYIYGIGNVRAKKILKALNIEESIRTFDISQETLDKVRDYINNDSTSKGSKGEVVLTEGDLRREKQSNIKRLIAINCYRGDRHKKRLPVRGQRTHTNARRGGENKKQGAVSNKKK